MTWRSIRFLALTFPLEEACEMIRRHYSGRRSLDQAAFQLFTGTALAGLLGLAAGVVSKDSSTFGTTPAIIGGLAVALTALSLSAAVIFAVRAASATKACLEAFEAVTLCLKQLTTQS